MTPTVIDGNRISEELKDGVVRERERLDQRGLACGLATVAVGEDYGALAYQRRLGRLAAELDVAHREIHLTADASTETVRSTIAELNGDRTISGVLVLRPLPEQIDESAIYRSLSPVKDIEAVHPENAGLLALGTPRYVPSTPASVFHVLDRWLDDVGEDRATFYHHALIVVVGRSNNVGKPAVSLAYDRQAAVESIDIWATRTGRLGWHTRRADVLIVAAGAPGLIRAEHVKQDAVVLDVGINPLQDPSTGAVRMVGDVAFGEVAPRARAITPVPGGIGPVTDVWLLRNTLAAAHGIPVATPVTSGARA